MKSILLKYNILALWVFFKSLAATDTQFCLDHDQTCPIRRFAEPCTFELMVWESETSDLKATLDGFVVDGKLEKYSYGQQRVSVKEALEGIMLTRLMWIFLDESQLNRVDTVIQSCAESLALLETVFCGSESLEINDYRVAQLTPTQKDHVNFLETEFYEMHLDLIMLFYAVDLSEEQVRDVQAYVEKVTQLSEIFDQLYLPFTPEFIRTKALIRHVQSTLYWILGNPMEGSKDEDFQLALLHSMQLSTSKILFIVRSTFKKVTSENTLYVSTVAKQSELLTSKFFFLYFHIYPNQEYSRSKGILTKIHANPVLTSIFEGVYKNLYKIARELRHKRYYLPKAAPQENSILAQRPSYQARELLSTQNSMGRLISILLENIVYSIDIHDNFGSSCYQKSRLEVWKHDARSLIKEFRAWSLNETAFPKVMVLYNLIESSTICEGNMRG